MFSVLRIFFVKKQKIEVHDCFKAYKCFSMKKEEQYMKKYAKVVFSIIVVSICFTLLYTNFSNDRKASGFKVRDIMNLQEDIPVIGSAYAQEEPERDHDVQLLARAVNGEARGEPYIGQVAVAAVILNRVQHPSFPNTIAGVIYQPRAFTAVADGQINAPIAEDTTVYKACEDAINGWDPSGGAIYYYNPEKTTNDWIYSREVIKTIGKHVFAR